MPRTIPAATVQRLNAAYTSSAILVFVTITHSFFGSDIRLVNDRSGHTTGGLFYNALGFTITLPDDTDERAIQSVIRIPNVTLEFVDDMRLIAGSGERPKVTFFLADTADINTQFMNSPDFDMVNIQYDKNWISADLTLDLMENESFPNLSFIPSKFPGLW